MALIVLAGPAGVGKTELLGRLARAGETVLDLEGLAHHRGSTFGGIGQPPQPPQRAFTAAVADALAAVADRPLWVEDEGPFLGSLAVPLELQERLAVADVVEVAAGLDERLARLTATYGHQPRDVLVAATHRIRPRLGDTRADAAIGHFTAGRARQAIAILLPYFDEGYAHRFGRLRRRSLGSATAGTRAAALARLAGPVLARR